MCASLGYNKTAVSISPFNLHSQKEAGMEIYSQGSKQKKYNICSVKSPEMIKIQIPRIFQRDFYFSPHYQFMLRFEPK